MPDANFHWAIILAIDPLEGFHWQVIEGGVNYREISYECIVDGRLWIHRKPRGGGAHVSGT